MHNNRSNREEELILDNKHLIEELNKGDIVKNIEVKNVSKITNGDGTTKIAKQPAKILKIKPKAIPSASIIGRNFSCKEYKIFNIRYKNIDKNTNLLTVRATIKADIANNTNSIHAKCIDILPEAIGLNFFTG